MSHSGANPGSTDDPSRPSIPRSRHVTGETLQIGEHVKLRRRGKRGIWICHFTFKGQHSTSTTNTSAKQLAERKARALEVELANGTFRKQLANRQTITAAVEEFMKRARVNGRSHKTIYKYVECLEHFSQICASRGVTLMTDIDRAALDAYRDHLRVMDRPNSAKTIYTKSIVVKQFVNDWTNNDDNDLPNPLRKVKLPEARSAKQISPTLTNVNNIIAAAAPGHLQDQLNFLKYTGCRVGELRRLRVVDVDCGAGWITFTGTEDGDSKKRGQSWRVPIHRNLQPTLERLTRRRRSDSLVFVSHSSSGAELPVSARAINDAVRRLAADLSLPVGRAARGMVAHAFRHFFKTYMINNGVPRMVVDAWQNHAGSGSASGDYFDLSDEESLRWMHKLSF